VHLNFPSLDANVDVSQGAFFHFDLSKKNKKGRIQQLAACLGSIQSQALFPEYEGEGEGDTSS